MDLLEEDPVRGVYIIREQLLKEHGGLRGWHEHVMIEQEEDMRTGRVKFAPFPSGAYLKDLQQKLDLIEEERRLAVAAAL